MDHTVLWSMMLFVEGNNDVRVLVNTVIFVFGRVLCS